MTGVTSGLKAGTGLRPMLRFPGQETYAPGAAIVILESDGAFAWSWSTGKRIYVYFVTEDGSVKSNRLVTCR